LVRRHPGRLWAPLNRANLAEVRLPDYVSRSRPRVVQGKRMKHELNEKECRALMVSRLRHNNASSNSSSGNSSRVVQSIRARVAGSRKVGKEGNQEKRHRPGSNNFGAITPTAPECENSGAVFV